MRVPFGWTCAALVAASALGTPLAAQQDRMCDSCAAAVRAATAARAASQDALEQARRSLEDAQRALMDQRRALFDNDTSTAAIEALRHAERQLEMAQRTYEMQVMRAMHAEAREATERSRAVVQRARVMQRQQESEHGWLGISFESGRTGDARGLPVIVTVAPGSPAERAGLRAGDVVMAINGRSLRRGMPAFDRVLKPGTQVPVRIQRGDETKTLNVVVGHRPSFYMFRFNPDSVEVHIPDFDMAPMPPMPAMPSPAAIPRMPPTSSMPPVPALAPAPPLGSYYFNGVSTIAGAQLWDVDQLKDYFHVDDGLLVLRVLPGTPADRAGLRSGDVIVRADGRPMTSVHTLERALEHVDERSADSTSIHTAQLDIVRKGKRTAVALKW